ncbi:MAG: hypothetical protein ACJ73S_28445 [Mycobacteriales bacterium]
MNSEARERARADARRLAEEYAARGDATGWFEALYRRGVDAVPWADLEPNPTYVRWADAHGLAGDGRTALVTAAGSATTPRSWPAGASRSPRSTSRRASSSGAGPTGAAR